MKKIVITWIICVLGILALFCWIGSDLVPQKHEEAKDTSLITSGFTLQTGASRVVKDTDFRGRYMLVFFGFTHCPDVCPTTLLLMQNAIAQAKVGERVQPIFITVDPERDTPKITAEYASHFGPHMLGLSGTAAAIKDAADHFKVYYSKMEPSDPSLGYMMNHSSFIYLMGPDGRYLTHFPSDIAQQALEDGLKRFVR